MTPAEAAAQQWHDQQVEADPAHEQWSSCWCCCWACNPNMVGVAAANPHYDQARAGN